MQSFWQDLRYGARMLRKQPGFTLIAVLTLALGIGANTAIFSVVNGILLRPLPYQEAERLVLLDEVSTKRPGSFGVSFPNFQDWRAMNQVFTGIAAYDTGRYTLTGTGEPEKLAAGKISYDTFEVLGVAPMLGRSFSAVEDQPGKDDVVILGHGLWARRFGARADIIGQAIHLQNRPRTVIGVMPPQFKFPANADLWVPLGLTPQLWTRTDHGLSAVARLKPGVTLAQAQSDLSAIARRIEEQHPVTNEGMGVRLDALRAGLTSDYQTSLPLLLGVVGMVLLIACANVAGLLLARASARQREMAVRAALGAGRARLIRQLLVESLLLGALGGAVGLAQARWGLNLLLATIPVEFPFWMKFTLDGRVIGFTLGVTLLTSLLFGLAPALQRGRSSQLNLIETLKEGGRSGSSSHHLRSLLVVAEIALSLLLLIGAGLMMRSFVRLQQVHPGFDPQQVMTAQIDLPEARYNTPEKQIAFYQQFFARVRALPSVEAAGGSSNLPLGNWQGKSLTVEGRPALSVGQAPMIFYNVITPEYRRALGIPLLAGRDFTAADNHAAPLVTIVDERLAREYWPHESALGKRIRFGPPELNTPWHKIVGVVAEVKQERLDQTRRRSIYVPHSQVTTDDLRLAIRGTTDPAALTAALRRELQAIDAHLPLNDALPMQELVHRSTWQPRLYALLFSLFAMVALLLAAVGIYGVMSYSVAQRRQEIGVRMALGARSTDVLKLVIGQGARLIAAGIGLGLVGAFALTRVMATLLFEVSVTDPPTFAAVVFVLSLVALPACWIPARRATKVDPLIALRCE